MEQVKITHENGITTISINRPKALNALSREVLSTLSVILHAEKRNASTRGLLLTSEGEKAFVAGADIAEMRYLTAEQALAFSALGQEVTCLLEDMPCSTIACVHGYALGGGCELAMGCDFIFASESAVFGQPEVHLGLLPGFGGCVRLAERIGISKAKEFIFTGRQAKANEAHSLGLVDRLFADKDTMLLEATKFLQKISSKSSPEAIKFSKQVMQKCIGKSRPEALLLEREGFAQVFATDNRTEGISAFLEKRPAEFFCSQAQV